LKNESSLPETRSRSVPTFGTSTSRYAKRTFDKAFPQFAGKVVVHHAVPQLTLELYPNAVSKSEMHSLENLRGIPTELDNTLHKSTIATAWIQFYKDHPTASKQQLLDFATEIDHL
jgi:hypothetical protein